VAAVCVLVDAAILAVAVLIGHTKIDSAVVKSIAIPVVYLHIWIGYAKNVSVHSRSTMRASGIKAFRVIVPESNPVFYHQPFVVGCIDNGCLASSQRDYFDRLIVRLDNRLSLDAVFGGTLGHDSTSNGIAVFDRFSILPQLEGGF
jgi:hypothetical protein